ncbi:MAG: hypothetical protein Q8L64_01855 [bacterium]|nr:hypothetical protein [bacterium]
MELSSSRLAINAAMTAWHLIEWIYWEYDFHSTIKNSDFIKEIKLKYPKLQIMHDISNGAKHFQLNHHSPKVMETKLDHGSYSDDYSRDYDISRLQVVIDDETCDFINELENVRDFWIEYFRNVLNVNIVLHENVA